MNNIELIELAKSTTEKAHLLSKKKEAWRFMGYVGAALITEAGNVYTGVNLALLCGIGFCAESSAIADMVKSGETQINRIVAVTNDGYVLTPCGRCRETIFQIDEINNLETEVIVHKDGSIQLMKELLPKNWQRILPQFN